MFLLYLPPHNSSKSNSSTLVSLPIQLQVFLFFFLPVYLLILLYKPTEHIHVAQLLLRVGPAWSVFILPWIIPLKKIGSPPNRYQLLIAPHFVVRFFHSLWSLPVGIFSGVSLCISWACITIVMSSYMQLS